MRAAPATYPGWINERYLALPASIPERVLALARNLTATAATPYDRALAIEAYLRRFPYTLQVPPPPPQRDAVDYFLFDLKKGIAIITPRPWWCSAVRRMYRLCPGT